LIGQAGLQRVDYFNQRCEVGIALGKDYWGHTSFARTPVHASSRPAFYGQKVKLTEEEAKALLKDGKVSKE
jgi:hypothetical protein